MKSFLILVASAIFSCLFLFSTAYAVPNLISYQGVLNDKDGVPISNTVTMIFTLYDAPTGGNALWNESQSVVVEGGMFNVKLGSVQQLTTSVFSSDIIYLGIQVGADEEMIPRQQITSSAFSMKADTFEGNLPIGSVIAWAPNAGDRYQESVGTFSNDGSLYDPSANYIDENVKEGMFIGNIKWVNNINVYAADPPIESTSYKIITLSSDPSNGIKVTNVELNLRYRNRYTIVFYYTDGSTAGRSIMRNGEPYDWQIYNFVNPNPDKPVYQLDIRCESLTVPKVPVHITDTVIYSSHIPTISTVNTQNYLTLSGDIFSVNIDLVYSLHSISTQNLPSGWQRCDGQVLNDTESLFHGQTLPNLNGQHSILRGNDSSGAAGDIESVTTPGSSTSYDVVWIMKVK